MANIVFYSAIQSLSADEISLSADSLCLMLTDGYIPDVNDVYVSAVAPYESAGTGYSRKSITKLYLEDTVNNRMVLSAVDITWNLANFTADGAVLFVDNSDDSSNNLIAALDFGLDKTSRNTPFVIEWNVEGVLYQDLLTSAYNISPYYKIKAGGIPNYTLASNMPNQWLRKGDGQDYSNERQLYRSLVTEAYNRHGVPMTFYVVSFDITNCDKIYGEDNSRQFVRKFDVMVFYPLQTEEKLWTKFALEGVDNFSIFISKDHFREACTYGQQLVPGNIGENTYAKYVPKTGDIIRSKYNSFMYEIVSVKEESMMVHLNKGYVWECVIHPFIDDHSKLNPITSASMAEIGSFVDKSFDLFDIKDVVTSAVENINYQPKIGERLPRDLNSGW
jgi:hypothetical protein